MKYYNLKVAFLYEKEFLKENLILKEPQTHKGLLKILILKEPQTNKGLLKNA